MQRILGATIGLLLVTAAQAAAQDGPERIGLGIAPHGGSLGLGVDVAYSLHPRVNVRGGANILPFEPEFTISDTRWALTFQSPQFHTALDLFLVSQFRITGGLRYASGDIEAVGVFTGQVEVGGRTYDGSDVGNLEGAIITNELAPWVGIGWGNVARSRIGFFLDLGVAFTGSPEVTLTADGPITTDPLVGAQFNSDLAAETQQFEDDISEAQYYPVVQLGLSFGF